MKLSVIMPAFNEERNIVASVSNAIGMLKENGFEFEVIVVDDGSYDKTFEVLKQEFGNHSCVKTVHYAENIGKGHAVFSGFRSSNGDVVAFIDGDGNVNPNLLLNHIELLKNADVVIASKNHPQSAVVRPLSRKILSIMFNILTRILTNVKVSDTQSGLKAFRRKALEVISSKIVTKKFAFDVEVLAIASLYGFKIVESPVEIRLNKGYFSIRQILKMFADLLAISYRLRVLKWYQRN